jgi:hypothetical protein
VDSVILTLFAGMLNVGNTIYGIVFLYAFFANAFFLVSVLFLLLSLIELPPRSSALSDQ